MTRFILLFILGALLMAAGLAVLATGLHSGHFAPFLFLAKGAASLALGAALLAPGLLGLAETCEDQIQDLRPLLKSRVLPADPELDLDSPERLAAAEANFWQAYQRAALGVGLFLFGLLCLAPLLSDLPFLAFITGLGIGIAILLPAAAALCGHSLIAIWRLHLQLDDAIYTLEEQPEIPPPAPAASRWTHLRRAPPPAPASPPG